MKKNVEFYASETLIHAWDNFLANSVGEKVFISDGNVELSYKEINALAHCLGAYLISRNITKNDVIFVLTENNINSCIIDLATCVCGAKRVFLSNAEDLHAAIQDFKPVCVLVTSENLYHQHRELLLSIASQTEILVQIKDTGDIPESEPIATVETVMDRGKIFWRENAELIKERKNSIKSSDCSLITRGLTGWNKISQLLLLKGIDIFAKYYSTEIFPKILSTISHADNLNMIAGWWMATFTGKRIYLSNQSSLEEFKKIQPQLWLASPEQLITFQQFIETKSWKPYYKSMIPSGQTILKNRTDGKPNGFILRTKCWTNGWYYRKLKFNYLKSVKGILVKSQKLPAMTDAFYELLHTPILGVWLENCWAAPALITQSDDRKIGSLGRLVFENSLQTTATHTSVKTKFFYSEGVENENYNTCFEVKNANYFIKNTV